MATSDTWQLPDGMDEVLPQQAEGVERLRRTLLDLFASWGYRLVIPPLVEFTDSLLVGLGEDLDLLTFKLTDQISGRTLGVRADITPQVARIDAHSLAEDGVSRLCYAGTTLHTQPKTLLASRSPIQVGAELYGENSLSADVEIVQLMLATVAAAGISTVTLDLGHVGIYAAVLAAASLGEENEQVVFDALQRKSIPDLREALAAAPSEIAEVIVELGRLHGDVSVLQRARDLLQPTVPSALPALDTLQEVAQILQQRQADLPIYFDLAELRGYHYHTGLVFAAYAPGRGQALANGGRYNDVGAVFGRARPATGFATDLKVLLALVAAAASTASAISAPCAEDEQLQERVAVLREAGEVVITRFADVHDPRCDRELVLAQGQWHVQDLA